MEKKLAIYSRTSTDKQEKGLEAQQRALHEYLKYKSIDDYLEFSDDGVSGMKRSRPGFDRLMEAVRSGQVHTVLVYSFSRFARSTKHLIDSLDEFDKAKIDFVSLSENIDTKGSVGRLIFKIFASLAEFERDQTAERVKTGLKNARAKGKILGRPARAREKNAEVISLHQEGMDPALIARQVGVSRASVYRAIKKREQEK